jgi:hypothetical protein
VSSSARSIGVRLGWLVAAVLLAFGAAGIVSGMSHPPGTAARSELTWVGDHEIGPRLVDAAADLGSLTKDVESLGNEATDALVAVNGGDAARIATATTAGQALLQTVQQKTDALRAKLFAIPGTGPGAEIRLGGIPLRRYTTLTGALDATGGLKDSWDRLTATSLAAVRLQTTLANHDKATAAAAKLGTAGKYGQAIRRLADSDDQIASAQKQRDAMSSTVDVSILTDWISRNAAYDRALRALYTLLRTAHGKATTAVQQAYAKERLAREQLPNDTRGLIIIMADLARGGLNQAVISIEETKGRLSAALDAFEAAANATDGGSPQPSPSRP